MTKNIVLEEPLSKFNFQFFNLLIFCSDDSSLELTVEEGEGNYLKITPTILAASSDLQAKDEKLEETVTEDGITREDRTTADETTAAEIAIKIHTDDSEIISAAITPSQNFVFVKLDEPKESVLVSDSTVIPQIEARAVKENITQPDQSKLLAAGFVGIESPSCKQSVTSEEQSLIAMLRDIVSPSQILDSEPVPEKPEVLISADNELCDKKEFSYITLALDENQTGMIFFENEGFETD